MGQNLTGQLISATYEDLVQISGSILTDGLGNNITFVNITASNATSASFATTASFALNVPATASFAISASHADNADFSISSSYAIVATSSSHALNADNSISSSYALTASFAENVTPINTGSFYVSSSVNNATITFTQGDGLTEVVTVNNVENAFTASIATSSSYALSASHADSSNTAISASHAVNADSAISSSYALTASFAENATPTFPFTGSATISGSLTVDGPINTLSGSFSGSVIDNLTTPTASDAVHHVVAISSTDYSAIVTPDPNTFYIINDITGSLILGDTVVSGSLTVTGTLDAPGLTVPTASFAISASYAVSASHAETSSIAINALNGFPFTGSAEISGSIVVEGHANIGYPTSNTVTGEIASVIAAISASATGQYAFVGGGISHNITAQYGAAVGGNNATVSGFRAAQLGGEFNDINGTTAVGIGGYNNNVGGTYNANVGGQSNNVGGTNGATVGATSAQGSGFVYAIIGGASHNVQTDSTVVAAGNRNTTISGHRDGGIFGGNDHIINGSDTDRSVIIGGNTNLIQSGSFGDSVIVGGKNNKVFHSASVVLGGNGLQTSRNEEVVVPRLTISGSFVDTMVIANYASIDFADDAAAASGGIPLGGVYRNGNFLMIRIV